MLFLQMIGLIAMAVLASAQVRPLLKEANCKFYDSFGDETSLACDGCYVMVWCGAYSNPCTETDYYYLIDENNNTVANASCNSTENAALLRLDINENTVLGPYRCKYGDRISDDALNLFYRLCSIRNRDVMEGSCKRPEDFCVIIAGNPKTATCNDLELEWCEKTHKATSDQRFCSGGFKTLCESFAQRHKPTAKMGQCSPPKDEDTTVVEPHIGYASISKYLYGAPIQMDKTEPTKFTIGFYASIVGGSNVTCTIKNRSGTILDEQSKVAEGTFSVVFGNDIFNHGTQLDKLECLFVKASKVVALLSNYLVVQVPEKVVIEVIKDEKVRKTVKCQQQTEPPDGFHDEYKWINGNGQTIGTGQELIVTQYGNVTCIVDRVFVSSGPYRRFPMPEPSSETKEIELEIPSTTTSSTKGEKETTNPGGGTDGPSGTTAESEDDDKRKKEKLTEWASALIGVAVIALIALAIVVAFFGVRKWRKNKSPEAGLLTRGKETLMKLAKMPGATDLNKLIEWCDYMKNQAIKEELDKELKKSGQKNEGHQQLKSVLSTLVHKVVLVGSSEEQTGQVQYVSSKKGKTLTFNNDKVTATDVEHDDVNVVTAKVVLETLAKITKGIKGESDRNVHKKVTKEHEVSVIYFNRCLDHSPPEDPMKVANGAKLIVEQAKEGFDTAMFPCTDGPQCSPMVLIAYLALKLLCTKENQGIEMEE